MKSINIKQGQKFGRLTIFEERPDGSRDRKFLAKCSCGNELIVRLASLRKGHTKSCGCYNQENRKVINLKHGHNTRNSGASPTYYTWSAMVQRCTNPKDRSYPRYGGRGITVSKKWLNFNSFLKDMGERPLDKTLDRINNNKGYSVKNCRWATLKEQGRNKRNNRFLTYKGQTKTLAEWAEIIGISWDSLDSRLKRGFTDSQAIEHKKYSNVRKSK